MVVVYWFLAGFPGIWWLLGAAFVILLAVVMSNLAPILILPLFFKLKPLADEELVRRLTELTQRAGKKVRGAFTMDLSSKSTTANAALMGWGSTRRIVLSDTLLHKYSPEEIEVVLAHELGHHAHNDIGKLIAVQSAFIVVGFYLVDLVLRASVPKMGFSGISDVAAFPLLALVIGAFALLLQPLTNAYSRHIESEADDYAIRMTGNPDAFISMMSKLADQNLSEAQPSRWVEIFFYDHPPYRKRVERAQAYSR